MHMDFNNIDDLNDFTLHERVNEIVNMIVENNLAWKISSAKTIRELIIIQDENIRKDNWKNYKLSLSLDGWKSVVLVYKSNSTSSTNHQLIFV